MRHVVHVQWTTVALENTGFCVSRKRMLMRAYYFEMHPESCLAILSMMSSAEPGRRKAYANDFRWRIVYERIGMHLPLEKIARNLNVSTSTANRINALFQRTGSVDPVGPQKRRLDLRRLDERSELFVVGFLTVHPYIL